MDPYVYTAIVDSVYDGDTITCTVRCGFGVELVKQKIRLYGLNTPEVRGESREQGLVARDKLREKILGKEIFLKTIKDRKGKYGRYLCIVYLGEENLKELLFISGLSVTA